MARGFVSGAVTGIIVGGIGLSILSLISELPPSAAQPPVIEQQEGAEASQPAGTTVSEGPVQPETDVDDEDVPLIGLQPPVPPADTVANVPDAPAETPDVDTSATEAPAAPNGTSEAAPNIAEMTDTLTAPQVPDSPGALEAPAMPALDTAPSAPPSAPVDAAESDDEAASTGPAEDPDLVSEETASTESGEGAARPTENREEEELSEAPPVLDTVPSITDLAPNVTTDRLPSIGDDGAVARSEDPAAASGSATDALEANAISFDASGEKPLFSIVMIDDPNDDYTPDSASSLGVPFTVVIDATAPDAAARSAAWRAAGYEVMVRLPLPKGAQPSDVEVALRGAIAAVPNAVALIDGAADGFSTDRIVTRQIVAALAQTGHGLVAYDRGLNAASQIASREDVPSALVYRVVDEDRESVSVIRRYLDRAQFRAQQEGSVMVVGHFYPDTLSALTEWSVSDRAASVALAPASAVLKAMDESP